MWKQLSSLPHCAGTCPHRRALEISLPREVQVLMRVRLAEEIHESSPGLHEHREGGQSPVIRHDVRPETLLKRRSKMS